MKNIRIAFLLLLFIAAITIAAHAQTQVFVPATATGCFGDPHDACVPLTAAFTVSGPGTITVTYVSGMVIWDTAGDSTGPNGTFCACTNHQFPLNEAHGVGLIKKVYNLWSLIGGFVPQSRALRKSFNALDGTKNITKVGIMPGNLFFIGESKTFEVDQAGTLFLGINDTYVGDNSGGFNVEVSFQQQGVRR